MENEPSIFQLKFIFEELHPTAVKIRRDNIVTSLWRMIYTRAPPVLHKHNARLSMKRVSLKRRCWNEARDLNARNSVAASFLRPISWSDIFQTCNDVEFENKGQLFTERFDELAER